MGLDHGSAFLYGFGFGVLMMESVHDHRSYTVAAGLIAVFSLAYVLEKRAERGD